MMKSSGFSVRIPGMRGLSKRFEQRRAELGLTLEEVAFRADVSVRSVYHVKDGTREPKLTTVNAVAKALRVTPQWLLFGDDPLAEMSVDDLTRLLLFLGRSKGQSADEIAALLKRLDERVDTEGDRAGALRVAEDESTYPTNDETPEKTTDS